MKNKIIVSLLLIFIIAISVSAVSANEDITDTISETSDNSDLELNAEDATNEAISEDFNEEIISESNTDDEELGGGVTIDNPVSVNNLEKFEEYVGTGKTYGDETTFKLNDDYSFNLTSPQEIKISCTIIGGTIKAENLDYFFKIDSPVNRGPSSLTIKDATFIITKEQSVIFANGEWIGDNFVTSTTGITLENITFQIREGVNPSTATLLYINKTAINNTFLNEINIFDNNLNGANSIKFGDVVASENHYDATEIIYAAKTKTTIVANSDIGRYVPMYLVDKSVGDSPIPFQLVLIDEDNHILPNKTISYALNGEMYTAVTDMYGIATLNIYLAQAGTHFIYSQFIGDDEYEAADMEVNSIILLKKVCNLTAKNISYKVNAVKKLSATFRDQNKKLIKNKKVTFTVNGKTYTATTNSKGVATVKITLNKKGTYYYYAKFAGDSMYTAANKKAKLTVVPLATSLTTKKYTYKKAAKTKKLTTTLKSGKTVLKSQKITFRVNGKNYVAKTNSKGIATVKIALKKKGTYTYSVKYAGNNKYKAVSKTNKVVIK